MKKTNVKEKINILISWMKQHPSILIWVAIAAVGLYMQWIIIGVSLSSVDAFSMEALAGVLTTSAEVVAGLYGLTLTCYIFSLK